MIGRPAVRAAEVVLVVVVAFVLPATVSSPDLYLICAAPCFIAAVALGYLDGRGRG